MKNTDNMRTRLNPQALRAAAEILRDMADACEECAENKANWAESTRKRDLYPRKSRDVILRLQKCRPEAKDALADFAFLSPTDGYEKLYEKVFGQDMIKAGALPPDYAESARYVLLETGLDKREADMLMRHLGIGPYDEPRSYEAIGNDVSLTRDRIRQLECRALRGCQRKDRREALLYGLAGYEKEKERRRIRIERALEEKTGAPLDMDTVVSMLKKSPVDDLGLDTRSERGLYVAGADAMLDLMASERRGSLDSIRGLGEISRAKIRKRLREHILATYGIELEELYKLMPHGWIIGHGTRRDREEDKKACRSN